MPAPNPPINPEQTVDPSVIPALNPSLLDLSETEWQFLRTKISSDDEEIKERLFEVQKEGYEKYPYPCIRAFHFVSLMMCKNEIYSIVVEEGKKGNTLFLDIGCCMGTDVRKLVQDGYPAANVLGSDLREEYIDLGYKLYQDKDTCQIRFFASDLLQVPYPPPTSSPTAISEISQVNDLSQLQGRLTHIYTGALFHLFDETTQYAMALHVGVLLKRERGVIVFGRHQGLEKEGHIADHMNRTRYGHSASSWTKMWKKVFEELEGEEFARDKVVVDATLTGNLAVVEGKETRMLYWNVRII